MSIGNQADQQTLIDRAKALSGCRCAYGPGGSGGLWQDQISAWGDPADLTLQGNAAWSGGGVVLDGDASTYLDSETTPDFATGIAGAVVTPADTLNYSGVSYGAIIAFGAGDLDAGRVLWQWHTGALQKFYMRVQPSTGYIDIWTASATQGGGYQTAPPGDRRVTIARDVRNVLQFDGTPNVIQIARGTEHPPEKTAIMLNGVVWYNAGSGNGISLFEDFATPWTPGLAQATPIDGDPAYSNLKGTMFGQWLHSRFLTTEEQQAIVAGFFDTGNRSNTISTGIGIGIS